MLESRSVRETVGQQWKDWVCQKDTRLANARDLAKGRGLTRAEVTFYSRDTVPSDQLANGKYSATYYRICPSCYGVLYSVRRDLES